MEDVFYIGLDAHKENVVATVLDGAGAVLDQAEFPAQAPQIRAYVGRWPGRRYLVLEACNVWEHVYDAAATAAQHVVLAHPYKTRVIAQASLKNDKVDSHALANLVRLNAVPTAYAPDPHTRELRRPRGRPRCNECGSPLEPNARVRLRAVQAQPRIGACGVGPRRRRPERKPCPPRAKRHRKHHRCSRRGLNAS